MAVGETESSIKVEAETVKCASCGFTEECTPAYIARIKERYQGKWICGLCIEAVKDEVLRSEKLISTEEALNRHISFCSEFRSFIPPKISVSEHPIFVMGRVLRRSLDSPRPLRTSSMRKLDEAKELEIDETNAFNTYDSHGLILIAPCTVASVNSIT